MIEASSALKITQHRSPHANLYCLVSVIAAWIGDCTNTRVHSLAFLAASCACWSLSSCTYVILVTDPHPPLQFYRVNPKTPEP